VSLKARVKIIRAGFELDVLLDVDDGETVAVLGPNGAGKTTLLRALAGLASMDGRVELDGEVLEDSAQGLYVPTERRQIGLVFQDHVLFPHLTVLDNVAFGLQAQGRGDARQVARRWLERNVPRGARLAEEVKTAPLARSHFRSTHRYSLATRRTLDQYRENGYGYLVANRSVRLAYTREAHRYGAEVSFYRDLDRRGCLLFRFRPSEHRAGPVIEIWALDRGTHVCQPPNRRVPRHRFRPSVGSRVPPDDVGAEELP